MCRCNTLSCSACLLMLLYIVVTGAAELLEPNAHVTPKMDSAARHSSVHDSIYAAGRSRTEQAADCHTGGTTDILSCYSPTTFSCSNDPRPLFANEAQLPAAPLLLLPHAPSSLPTLIMPGSTVTTPFLLNIGSPEVYLLRYLRKRGKIPAAVAKGRVRRF